MKTQEAWLEITIAGFFYLVAAFFAVLDIFGIYDLCFLFAVQDSLIYISLVMMPLSFACGYAIDVLSHPIIAWIKGTQQSDASEEIQTLLNESDHLLLRRKAAYSTFLLFRHLMVSSILLIFSLGFWLYGAKLSLKWIGVVVCFAILFGLSYRRQLAYYENFKDAIQQIRKKKKS